MLEDKNIGALYYLGQRDRGMGRVDYAVMMAGVDGGTVITENLPLKQTQFIITALNSHYELLEFAKNFEIKEKEDGLWFILHGNGTTGKAMFNLGSKDGLASSVAKFLEQDRQKAIAKAEGK